METLKQRILGRGPPDSPTEDLELCEIEVSKDGAFHVKPHEEAKIWVNGSEVKQRIALFHEDWIQLEDTQMWFVVHLPNQRRPGSHSCPETLSKKPCGHLDNSNQDPNVILLSSKSGLELSQSANLSKVSLHYNIHDAPSRLGLSPSGGVTFHPKATSPRCKSLRRVGLFFWDGDTEVSWLVHQLISKNIVSVSCLPLSEANDQSWRSASSRCSTIIFCHSMRSKKPWYNMEGYLDHCLQSHGPGKVLMAITDLEGTMCEKGIRAQWGRSQWSECDLLLFTEMEMDLLIQQRLTTESHIMEAKLNQIKCILQERVTDIMTSNKHQSCRKHMVGIFSKSTKNSFVWLKNLLTSAEKFKDLVRDVRLFHNVNVKDQKALGEISQCTFMILYHSKKHGDAKITNVPGASYKEELEYLSAAVGKENTIVVIDDMVKNRSAEKMKILQEQPSIQRLVLDLFLFGVKEKDKQKMEGQKIKEKLDTVNALITVKESKSHRVPVHGRKMEEATDHRPQLHEGHTPPRQMDGTKPRRSLPSMGSAGAPLQMLNDNHHLVGCDPEERTTPGTDSRPEEPMPELIPKKIISSEARQRRLSTRHVVGIFSRSPQRDYYWLRDVLQAGSHYVQDIRHGYMLDSGSVHWMQVLTECTFGILYHKNTTGRLHITDVTGSLYDKELRYLSEHLGQENVFVVVDDVEDPSLEKTKILEKQPSIKRLTRGLEVFGRDKGYLLEKSSQVTEIFKFFDSCRTEERLVNTQQQGRQNPETNVCK